MCIAAPVTFGSFGLAPMVANYLDRYPQVQVELLLVDRCVDLVSEGFEAAIQLGSPFDASLRTA
nr:LysR substrate-binding domain-containing protein [Cupriavidus necator]